MPQVAFILQRRGILSAYRSIFMVGLTQIMLQTRKGVKGLRLGHISPIMLIGDLSGIRCSEAATISKTSQPAMYQKLRRIISAGYVHKTNKRYYLTDKGQLVYNRICREFDVEMKGLIEELVREARKRIDDEPELGELE